MAEQNEALAVTKQAISLSERGGLQLAGINDMWRFAGYVAASGLAPKGMESQEQIIIALELGYEVGLPPMQAIQNIAVINGRAAIWGDAMLALVRASGLMKSYKEEEIGTPYEDNYGFRVTSVRKAQGQSENEETLVTTFTVAKAKQASLWKKAGPWTFYPDRMLKMRARSFNLRDNFPDVLKGMVAREEAKDFRNVDVEIIETEPRNSTKHTSEAASQPSSGQQPSQPSANETAKAAGTEAGPTQTGRRGRPKKETAPATPATPPAEDNPPSRGEETATFQEITKETGQEPPEEDEAHDEEPGHTEDGDGTGQGEAQADDDDVSSWWGNNQ